MAGAGAGEQDAGEHDVHEVGPQEKIKYIGDDNMIKMMLMRLGMTMGILPFYFTNSTAI